MKIWSTQRTLWRTHAGCESRDVQLNSAQLVQYRYYYKVWITEARLHFMLLLANCFIYKHGFHSALKWEILMVKGGEVTAVGTTVPSEYREPCWPFWDNVTNNQLGCSEINWPAIPRVKVFYLKSIFLVAAVLQTKLARWAVAVFPESPKAAKREAVNR